LRARVLIIPACNACGYIVILWVRIIIIPACNACGYIVILWVRIIIPACNACGYIVILWVRIIIIILLLLLQTLHNDKASDKTRAAPEPMSGTQIALGP